MPCHGTTHKFNVALHKHHHFYSLMGESFKKLQLDILKKKNYQLCFCCAVHAAYPAAPLRMCRYHVPPSTKNSFTFSPFPNSSFIVFYPLTFVKSLTIELIEVDKLFPVSYFF